MPEASSGQRRLHYDVSGSGPTVLWHTGGCGDHEMWVRAGYLDAMPGFQHVAMDHRGHGQSDPPAPSELHDLNGYVEDVIAVLDHANVERCAFVGYSFGSAVAYAMAIAHPERLWAVVSLDGVAPPSIGPDDYKADATYVRDRGTQRIMAEMAEVESAEPPQWLLDNLCRTSTEAYAQTLDALATAPDLLSTVVRLTAPTLFLIGVDGESTDNARWARDAVSLVPNGRVEVLRGLTHLQAFWRVDLSGPAIQDFLRSRSESAVAPIS